MTPPATHSLPPGSVNPNMRVDGRLPELYATAIKWYQPATLTVVPTPPYVLIIDLTRPLTGEERDQLNELTEFQVVYYEGRRVTFHLVRDEARVRELINFVSKVAS